MSERETTELIEALSRSLGPAPALRPPLLRAAGWLILATLVPLLLGVGHGVRADLALRLADVGYTLGIAGALGTGMLAAIAAFMLSLPDRSRRWILLPMPALVLWLSGLGDQCLTHWVGLDPAGLSLGETAQCFATLVLTGLPLSLALLVMLRHGAALAPTMVSMIGSLAVAGFTAAALSLLHQLDATVMIMLWNIGIASIFLSLGAAYGRRMLPAVEPKLDLE
jgi:hypothetical protein